MIPALLSLIFTAQALEMRVPPPVMAEHATAIVVGEVTSSHARWAADTQGFIQTETSWAVESVLKGDVPESLLVLLEGGEIGEYRSGQTDQPTLLEDHRYLMLLLQDDQGVWRPFSIRGTVELRSEKAPGAPTVAQAVAAFGVNHGL